MSTPAAGDAVLYARAPKGAGDFAVVDIDDAYVIFSDGKYRVKCPVGQLEQTDEGWAHVTDTEPVEKGSKKKAKK